MNSPRLRKQCLLLLFTVAANGCNRSTNTDPIPPQNKIVGHWSGTVTLDRLHADKLLTADQIKSLQATKLDIRFDDDGGMTLMGSRAGTPYESHGTWELLSEADETVTLQSHEFDGEAKQIELIFHGVDNFSMPLPGPTAHVGAMDFRRLR